MKPDSRIAELEGDLDAAQHLLHEIVIVAFRREHGRDPASKAEYRAYHRKLYEEACAAKEDREAPKWLTVDDESDGPADRRPSDWILEKAISIRLGSLWARGTSQIERCSVSSGP